MPLIVKADNDTVYVEYDIKGEKDKTGIRQKLSL